VDLAARLGPALEALRREGAVADFALRFLPGREPPWTDTGLALAAGEAFTWLAEGRLVLSAQAGLWGGPRLHLWGRVGDGPVFCGTRATTTRVADRAGPLRLGVYHGEWPSPQGGLPAPREAYAALDGGFRVAALRWGGGLDAARRGLARLEALGGGDAAVRSERARLDAPVLPPPGWEYLWFLGESEIFRPARSDEGRPAVEAVVEGDVGILRRPLSPPVALGEDSALAWRWRVDELPSSRPEDALLHHDYLSLAIEFDDGRDLTWMWSAGLPPERHFVCPIPQWAPRETHLVVRSGSEGLGRWQSETRSLAADARRALGALPARAVAVWLIAVAVFQHGRGRAAFADITLRSRAGGVALP
jgi:hypothetical protein